MSVVPPIISFTTATASADAVVKDIIGGTTDKDVPRCPHGPMHWAHGMTKANKPWVISSAWQQLQVKSIVALKAKMLSGTR